VCPQPEDIDLYAWTVKRAKDEQHRPVSKTDRLDEATQEALVRRLEARGQRPLFSDA
jgi:hypothetical protein